MPRLLQHRRNMSGRLQQRRGGRCLQQRESSELGRMIRVKIESEGFLSVAMAAFVMVAATVVVMVTTTVVLDAATTVAMEAAAIAANMR